MVMNDVWNQDAFGVVGLTASINKLPYTPGQVGRLGIFNEDGVTTDKIAIEELDGQLTLVASSARGGPGETVDKEERKTIPFMIPHYQRDDAVMADEVQGVREFGSEQGVQTVQGVVDSRMMKHSYAFDATLEHQRVGALKGRVFDKRGRLLVDLFTAFGKTAPTAFSFTFSDPTFDVREMCFDVITTIEDALDGNTYDGIHAVVGKSFYKSLIGHPSVEKTYLNWIQAEELRSSGTKGIFDFGDINWERYRTGKQATADVGSPFIADNEVRFVVKGVPDLFITRFAPADYEETVNTKGLPRYAKQYPMPNGKGRNLEMQMNALSLCTRPETLQFGTAA